MAEPFIERAHHLGELGDMSCRVAVAFGSSVASSMATPLRRSVNERSALAESDRVGSEPSRVPTGLRSPVTAWEIPAAASSTPMPARERRPPSARGAPSASRPGRPDC